MQSTVSSSPKAANGLNQTSTFTVQSAQTTRNNGMQNTQPTPMNKRIMMPVAGAPLFISDRTRDHQIRNETMKQANLHSKAIHELHT